jgi:hypothetical protein
VGAPRLLAASGAPELPAIGGANLLLALAPAVVVVAAVIALAGGFHDARARFVPLSAWRPTPPTPVTAAITRLRRARVGLAFTALLGFAGLVLAIRLVLLAGRAGFL